MLLTLGAHVYKVYSIQFVCVFVFVGEASYAYVPRIFRDKPIAMFKNILACFNLAMTISKPRNMYTYNKLESWRIFK